MAFGRSRQQETFETVPWQEVTEFLPGTRLRDTLRRSKAGEGGYAIRTRQRRTLDDSWMVPSVHILAVDPSLPLAKGGFRLCEDEAGERLLCTVLPDGADTHRVTDPAGHPLGAVHRLPRAKQLGHHPLWLEQPGHHPVMAPRSWAKAGLRTTMTRAAGGLASNVADSLMSFGAEGGDTRTPPTPVMWAERLPTDTPTYAAPVLSQTSTTGTQRWYQLPHTTWLDKRLAFALATLREREPSPRRA